MFDRYHALWMRYHSRVRYACGLLPILAIALLYPALGACSRQGAQRAPQAPGPLPQPRKLVHYGKQLDLNHARQAAGIYAFQQTYYLCGVLTDPRYASGKIPGPDLLDDPPWLWYWPRAADGTELRLCQNNPQVTQHPAEESVFMGSRIYQGCFGMAPLFVNPNYVLDEGDPTAVAGGALLVPFTVYFLLHGELPATPQEFADGLELVFRPRNLAQLAQQFDSLALEVDPPELKARARFEKSDFSWMVELDLTRARPNAGNIEPLEDQVYVVITSQGSPVPALPRSSTGVIWDLSALAPDGNAVDAESGATVAEPQ